MDLLEWAQNGIDGILEKLPLSPFHDYIVDFSNSSWIGYFNWFIPVKTLVQITLGWITCIGVFYLVSIVLRWIKAIE